MFKQLSTFFSKKPQRMREVKYRVQDIWWCSVPSSTDAAAERPVLVFRTLGTDTFWGLPLTSRASGRETPFYFLTSLKGANRAGTISQMRMLRKDQLIRKLGRISDRQFATVNLAVMEFLAETNPVKPAKQIRPSRIRTPLPRPRYAQLPTFKPTYALKFR